MKMKPSLPKQAPRFFGEHPDIRRRYDEEIRRGAIAPLSIQTREVVPLSQLQDPRHPNVYLIPRGEHLLVVDDQFHDPIGLFAHQLWFGSHNFFLDTESPGVFHEFDSESDAFWRMGGIPQLGFLVPPFPETNPDVSVSILPPLFPHTRWIHCLLTAALAEVILARNGFSQTERNPFVLTAGYHDIAMPAGGDSVKRIDPKDLDEEANFLYALNAWDLIPRWKREYGFDPNTAEQWVHNQGTLGLLLDVVDKLSYVSLDVYYLAKMIDGPLRTLALTHPLFTDIWQDIRFTPDKSGFAFTDPDRLYIFLLARAYEHRQLLLNPYARVLDFFFTNLVSPLYANGTITKHDLLVWTTQQLQDELAKWYSSTRINSWMYTPEEYGWKYFETQTELDAYAREHKSDMYFSERLKGFRTGLDWPVYAGTRKKTIVPLYSLLSRQRIQRMRDIVSACQGYYAYWYKPLS